MNEDEDKTGGDQLSAAASADGQETQGSHPDWRPEPWAAPGGA